jgi:ADP-ribose pyrophosphatase
VEETLASRVVFDGQVVRLRVDDIRLPDGRRSTREIVERGDCVAVVAVDADGNVLLVKQFRRAAGKDLLEIPAGGIDPGEEPEATVRREMREEAGYLPKKVEKMAGFHVSPGFCTEYMHLYLATDLVPDRLYAEDSDSIELVRVPLKEITGLIVSGAICDAKSIAGLLMYLYLKNPA